jgi:hypothetical protein
MGPLPPAFVQNSVDVLLLRPASLMGYRVRDGEATR